MILLLYKFIFLVKYIYIYREREKKIRKGKKKNYYNIYYKANKLYFLYIYKYAN